MNKKEEYKFWFHGTDKKNADKILKEGFNKGTFFSRHLEDALGYGGKYVFEVALKLDCKYWEYVSSEHIPQYKIARLKQYTNPILLKRNNKLCEKVFNYNS